MSNIQESIQSALAIEGTIGAALGNWGTGFSLGQASSDGTVFSEFQLKQAITLNSEVIKAKNKAREGLQIKASIEDILITLEDQYHLIRMCELAESVFFYLVLDRKKAKLGLARMELRELEKNLRF